MRTKRAILTTLAVLLSGGVAGSVAMASVERPHGSTPEWLGILNSYRASAGLAPVGEVTLWSGQATEHARYQVINGQVTAEQRPTAEAATTGGAEVARNADLAGVANPDLTDRQAIESWMTSPFHALGILRPRLQRVGYGKWLDPTAPVVRASAVLDLLRGLGPSRDGQRPVSWPGDESTVPLSSYAGAEVPDPLTSCPGYHSPAGLPVLTLFPTETNVSSGRVEVDGRLVESCLVTSGNYVNPDPQSERRGRDLLAVDHAVVVIPRSPLPVAGRVRVSLDTAEGVLSWSFSVGAPGSPIEGASTR